MKKSKITALVMATLMFIGIVPAYTPAFAADPEANNPAYAYFMNTAEGSAHVWLGSEIEEKGIKFYDGQAMGITDSKDPLYNETVMLDGLVARKQYSANSSYFKLDESFYEPTDTEFLISLVFYDFGPSEGKFYFEYITTTGNKEQITIIKPGTNPGWMVKTMCLSDVDMQATYENGANFRIQNGAYNAFKKLEIVNIGKARREKKSVEITNLGADIRTELEQLNIIKKNDTRFTSENLGKACIGTDAVSILNVITAKSNPNDHSGKALTQGELVEICLNALKLSKGADESWIDAGKRWGVIDPNDFLLFDEAPATNYNLINLMHGTLVYENSKGEMLLANLINSGFYENADIPSIRSEAFQRVYYAQPRKLPKKKIINATTGRTYYYINFFGATLLRGYTDCITVLPDGKGMVCATEQGQLYRYDFDSEMLYYLDQTVGYTSHASAYCCPNGWVYYQKRANNITTIWRIDPYTFEKEELMDLPLGFSPTFFITTNDGRYMSFECYTYGKLLPVPENTTAIVRADLVEKKIDYTYYGFDYVHYLNHHQINPVYPNIMAFSHEFTSSLGMKGIDIYDRLNIMDMDTGEVWKYDSGRMPDGRSGELVSHEIWGMSGNTRYFTVSPADSTLEHTAQKSIGRVDLEGRHRQYFEGGVYPSGGNHVGVSGDERMLCFDGWVTLVSTETHQLFPIVQAGRKNTSGKSGHPYHAHPHVSYSGNVATWGEVDNNVLGIAWINYTDILENEVAKGGRYEFGDDATIVSYEGLECDSYFTTKAGRDAVAAKIGSSIFVEIDPEIIDTVNGAAKITFDYFDNGTAPMTLTYTKGVEQQNDILVYFNRTIEIPRNGTNKWQTAEVVIDCGNFENIGKFETDFKIRSGQKTLFLSNIKVEAIKK